MRRVGKHALGQAHSDGFHTEPRRTRRSRRRRGRRPFGPALGMRCDHNHECSIPVAEALVIAVSSQSLPRCRAGPRRSSTVTVDGLVANIWIRERRGKQTAVTDRTGGARASARHGWRRDGDHECLSERKRAFVILVLSPAEGGPKGRRPAGSVTSVSSVAPCEIRHRAVPTRYAASPPAGRRPAGTRRRRSARDSRRGVRCW